MHYFEHFTTDPEQMTDLPKDKREAIAEKEARRTLERAAKEHTR